VAAIEIGFNYSRDAHTHTHTHTNKSTSQPTKHTHTHIHVFIYLPSHPLTNQPNTPTPPHTHTYTYIHIYIYTHLCIELPVAPYGEPKVGGDLEGLPTPHGEERKEEDADAAGAVFLVFFGVFFQIKILNVCVCVLYVRGVCVYL
jgi:hypothetical protein